MKISLITGHKADYLIRKETPELKKGFKVFLTLAAIGSFIGFILAYFCKSSTKQDMNLWKMKKLILQKILVLTEI